MIKKSSFIVAILLIVCLSISSVSATALDNSSGNEILNSTGMTTDDIDTINDCSVADNFESADSVESNVVDQSSVNVDESSVVSDSNSDSENLSDEEVSKDKVASDNVAVDEDSSSESNVKKVKSASFTNLKSDDNEKLSAEDADTLNALSVANNFDSDDSSQSENKMSADDADTLNAVSVADNFDSDDSEGNSDISVSNLGSESQISNDDTSDESIGSVSVPYEVDNTNGGMSDNIGNADVASQEDVSDPVMITSTMVALSNENSDVKNTEIVSLITSLTSSTMSSSTKSTSVSTASSKVSISDIIKGANNLKQYVLKNKKLPSTVTVGKQKYSIDVFTYLMSQAILSISSSKTSKISVIKVSGPSAYSSSIYKNATKATYLKLARTVANAGVNKKALPKYVSFSSKKADYQTYSFAFAKILAFYDSKDRLPNTCLFDSSVFKKSSSGSYVTVSQVATASKNVKAYVVSHKKLPKTVTVGNKKVSIETFSVLVARSIKNINAKKTSAKMKIVNVTKYSYAGQSISETIDSSAVLNIAKQISSSASENKKVPKYVLIGGKKAGFDLYTYGLVKDLDFYKSKKRLANKVTFSSSALSSGSNLIMKKGINEKCTTKDLSAYLKASGNCALNSQIKELAKSLTKNCKTEKEKVNAIFKYVRDKVDYSFYYNSKKKASGALSSKKANCCDKANLVVALCRASGIAARYSHSSSCHFSSGLTCGHVWAQVKVGNYWLAADTTSSRNTLGTINNWNTGSLGKLNQYSSLPF